MKPMVNVFWFRRDLRLDDNAGLNAALRSKNPVLPIFIFDTTILCQLDDSQDKRIVFISAVLEELQGKLVSLESSLEVYYGHPLEVFTRLLHKYHMEEVFTNHDYEPSARERDQAIAELLKNQGIILHTTKDQVIFEKNEVIKDDGTPYTIFTPYSKRWKAQLNDFYLSSYPIKKYLGNFYKQKEQPIPSLHTIGFKPIEFVFPSKELKQELIRKYTYQRDFPAIQGTSRLGIHLRFGTISIRVLASKALSLNATFVNELIWRDFYQMILWHFPHVGKGKAFKPAYDHIQWRNDEKDFERWREGTTGYPIVDAGMRELNETGFMHNRVRMITASFLAKHLLIDWRWGEAWFAKKLLDYDLAANNGGWQWAAGSGCDAAPYFRIFNPTLQMQKFDRDLKYIRHWVPELETLQYPAPMVIHEVARDRALKTYARAIKGE